MEEHSLEQVLVQSDAIVVGTVVSVEKRWNEGGGTIARTYITLRIDEVIKGKNIGKTMKYGVYNEILWRADGSAGYRC